MLVCRLIALLLASSDAEQYALVLFEWIHFLLTIAEDLEIFSPMNASSHVSKNGLCGKIYVIHLAVISAGRASGERGMEQGREGDFPSPLASQVKSLARLSQQSATGEELGKKWQKLSEKSCRL